MSTANKPDNNVQLEGVNNVLDCVLENIDDLLMDNIPPNPSLPPLPPLPYYIPQTIAYPYPQLNDDYMISSPQFYLQQSVNNNYNNVAMVNSHNNLLSGYHKQQQQLQTMTQQHFFTNNNDNKTNRDTILMEQVCNANNNNNNNNKSFITPSSSYNSLVSLTSANTTNTTNTSSTRSTLLSSNKNNNLLITDKIKIISFDASSNCTKLQLKDHVFISKACTSRLSEYIVKEEWGKNHTLLYKHIDYIFRCQAFKKQIITINNKHLVFHSGLQRRNDKQLLFGLLTPNKKFVTPKWRVASGNIKNSFLSKQELLSKLPQSYLVNDYLPKRTKFFSCLSQLLYDDTFSIDVNWEERLITNKDRIHRILGEIAFFDANIKFLRLTELIKAFKKALQKTQQIAELNPRLAVAQGFIDTKHCSYRMELLLPLIIEFPLNSSNFFIFALAMNKSQENEKKYVVKSILTMDMAYSNARLVGYVDSNWLFYGKNNNRADVNEFFCKRHY